MRMGEALASLKRLEALKFEFGSQAAEKKQDCLRALATSPLSSAAQVNRLHEVLCFMQAWPDDGAVLLEVESLLARFHRRRDLRKHVDALADTGIAGTRTHFSFYAATALWLAERCPDRLGIDWEEFENTPLLERYLSLLGSYSESLALDNVAMDLPDWINRLKGPSETDAAFVIHRLAKLTANDFLFERLYEEFDIPLIVLPGDDAPSHTRAKYEKSPVEYQTAPLDRARPSAAEEIRHPPKAPRLLSRAKGRRLIDLAHAAMATRHRDLDAFAYADPLDVSLIDDHAGLQFVLYGMLPHRRFLLETQYGYLVLKNGVPVSYGSVVSLFNSAEVAYTIFDTFRGGESARLYLRTLTMAAHLFGCDTFMIDPYQLGQDNQDALDSGAWWFYQKLGYRPRDAKLLRLMEQELAKMKRRPGHRSTIATLKRLASDNVYLNLDDQRNDVLGLLNLANVGLKITDLLATRFGSDREAGEQTLATEAAQRLAIDDFRDWTPGEKLAWRRWGPLVALLPNLEHWPAADRKALAQLIRAKGGRQELTYLLQFNAIDRLRAAVVELAQE